MSSVLTPKPSRIVVIGTSSSGKSTLAGRLAGLLDVKHIELDEFHWGPNWQPMPREYFVQSVDEASSASAWVSAGNFSQTRDLLWSRANVIIWLDYSFPIVLGRGLRRAIHRSITRAPLWNGNRESLTRTFLSRDSILLWILKTYSQRRRDFSALQSSGRFSHAQWLRFTHPRETEAWVERLSNEINQ